MSKPINSQTQAQIKHKKTRVAVHYSQNEQQYHVLYHGIPLKTPYNRTLLLPNLPLAQALADEWQSQGDKPVDSPGDRPLTAIANTALDHTASKRTTVLDTLTAYASHDLLCYLVDKPQELADRQQAAWQPIHDWVKETHGIGLNITSGITPIPQPPDSLSHLRSVVAAYDDMTLTAFGVVVAATGSFLLGLYLAHDHLAHDRPAHDPMDSQTVFTVSHLEEIYQNEQWGHNPAIEARHKSIAAEIKSASHFLRLCRSGNIG